MTAIIKKFRIKSFKQKDPIIEFKNVSLAYGNRLILDNISFKIQAGTIFGMLGPNGVGKSTIFNLLTGLISPKNGRIFIHNKDATNYPVYLRTRMFSLGYVPQYGGAFSDLTTLDNLKAIGEIVVENKSQRDERIDFLMSKFELDNVKDIKFKHLSGGQKRRLTIGLALLGKPKILLLDEPMSALDILSIKMLQEIIVNLQVEEKITCLVTDHQAKSILTITDSAMILNNGKIVAQDSPSNLIKDSGAIKSYFGDNFKIN
tara:strand:+ start:65 stop:844 length:780 start_codon:yes stop_codon:yes gene_type:complete